ncbi:MULTISPECIES: SigE family RNA polymerase sigma factor [unclassified Parafrankia]|uniref:SigE family RNA polymerase sigma factor n=1 Tax=unclassified Parafrankia TaxID=2994368 RepID=UPI000DA5E0D9|nr:MULTISPECIES: SigE family RNA polymerase sigma factor [unclassified Parafrankia]TCJ35349.1 SigE family RNA polymerase sigma factor [Parafrankia sp. BMG5.11]SQD99828.1 RNA polymerase, sigma-24 subunit, ECF subfamily [Parafrankia sp. Ea1.12]
MDDDGHDEFRAYFAARLPALLRLAYLLTGDAAEAEDLAQTALARTFVAWRKVRVCDSPDAYVRRILVNAHRRRFRGRRVVETLMPTVPDRLVGGSAGELAAVEDRAGLAAALAALPTRQRAVVVLRYCEDLSEARVAEILGCSVGTVKTHASRGLARLRADPSLGTAMGPRSDGVRQPSRSGDGAVPPQLGASELNGTRGGAA